MTATQLSRVLALAAVLFATHAVEAQSWKAIGPPHPMDGLEPIAFDPVRGRALMFGGVRSIFDPLQGSQPSPVDSTWEWNGSRWRELEALNPRPRARTDAAIAYDRGRREFVMFGGTRRFLSFNCNELGDTWVFDGERWSSRPGPGPQARTNALLVYDAARDQVVLHGGYEDCTQTLYNDTWIWDGTSWTQAQPATVPTGFPIGFVYDKARSVCVMLTGQGGTFEWDGTNWSARTTPNSPTLGGRYASLIYDAARQRVVSVGNELWDYDGTDWTFLTNAPTPSTRPAEAFFDSNLGRIVWMDREVFEWNGTAWDLTHTNLTVFGRAAVYDRIRDVTISSSESGLFAYDGHATERLPTTQTPIGSTTVMAFDEARDRLVAFDQNGDTWEYDQVDWQLRNPTNAPPTRQFSSMTYDATRQVVVLFGGQTNSPRAYLDDTWEWDGVDWTLRTPATKPQARSRAQLTYDRSRGRTILLGGSQGTAAPFDYMTWEWDGQDWQSTATVPGNPNTMIIAYDDSRAQVVMVASDPFGTSSTLTYDGISWQMLPGTLQVAESQHLIYDRKRSTLNLYFGSNPFGFSIPPGHWRYTTNALAAAVEVGPGCAAPGGSAPRLLAGRPALGNSAFRIDMLGDPARPGALIALGLLRTPVTAGPCTWQLGAPLDVFPTPLDGDGLGRLLIPLPEIPSLIGVDVFTQGLNLNPNGPVLGLTLTRALRLTLGI